MMRNGKLTFPNGTVFSGLFKDDKPISGHLKTDDWEGSVEFLYEEEVSDGEVISSEGIISRKYELTLLLQNGDRSAGCFLQDGVLHIEPSEKNGTTTISEGNDNN